MSPAITHARGVRYKTLDASIQEVTGRHIEFIASQELVDRDGDVIECAGIDTTDFMRNPIFLGDHNKQFILGKITRLWKERLPEGPALLAKAELLPAGVSAQADERYAAIKFGAAKGISIGFLSHAHEPTPTGYRYKSVSLMEVSSVSIPSCPTCVITSKSTQQQLRSAAPHFNKERTMYVATDEPYLEVSDDFFAKAAAEDDFAAMCARMLAAYEEMTSAKFRELMARQIALLGPNASIDQLVQAMSRDGVVAPKHWRDADELIDVDDDALATCISRVVVEAVGTQTRAALYAALGRLD